MWTFLCFQSESGVVMVCVNSEHYSHQVLPDSDLIRPADGELVVARCTVNERWCRAMVVGSDVEHNTKVSCITDPSSSLMSSKYQSLPAQF